LTALGQPIRRSGQNAHVYMYARLMIRNGRIHYDETKRQFQAHQWQRQKKQAARLQSGRTVNARTALRTDGGGRGKVERRFLEASTQGCGVTTPTQQKSSCIYHNHNR